MTSQPSAGAASGSAAAPAAASSVASSAASSAAAAGSAASASASPAASFGATVCAAHDQALAASGGPPVAEPPAAPAGQPDAGLHFWIATNHRYNSLLWAEEDLARRTTVADSDIAANKRAIDRYNQARNDATERVDECLLIDLGLVDAASARTDAPLARVPAGARLNSETAGSMVDRLSIMALKIHAMRLQAEDPHADAALREACSRKLAQLQVQRADLAACLDALLADCRAGRAYFKVYRQFKMYNDPRLNPVLAAEARQR